MKFKPKKIKKCRLCKGNKFEEIFNLGNDNPLKTIEVLETIEKKLNKTAKIRYVKTKNEMFKTHANIEKAKKLLSYKPMVCFNEGIESFLKWHKHYGDI